jgi:KaiC/GvpD/RAD55 family RecA-like ATPase
MTKPRIMPAHRLKPIVAGGRTAGRFVSFEGVDGSGKSTQLSLLLGKPVDA